MGNYFRKSYENEYIRMLCDMNHLSCIIRIDNSTDLLLFLLRPYYVFEGGITEYAISTMQLTKLGYIRIQDKVYTAQNYSISRLRRKVQKILNIEINRNNSEEDINAIVIKYDLKNSYIGNMITHLESAKHKIVYKLEDLHEIDAMQTNVLKIKDIENDIDFLKQHTFNNKIIINNLRSFLAATSHLV